MLSSGLRREMPSIGVLRPCSAVSRPLSGVSRAASGMSRVSRPSSAVSRHSTSSPVTSMQKETMREGPVSSNLMVKATHTWNPQADMIKPLFVHQQGKMDGGLSSNSLSYRKMSTLSTENLCRQCLHAFSCLLTGLELVWFSSI